MTKKSLEDSATEQFLMVVDAERASTKKAWNIVRALRRPKNAFLRFDNIFFHGNFPVCGKCVLCKWRFRQ
jgi:hypothetical protein